MSASPTLVVRLNTDDAKTWGYDCETVAKTYCSLPVLAAKWSHDSDKWDGKSWPRPDLTDAERDAVKDAKALRATGGAPSGSLVNALLAIIARTSGGRL